MSPQLPEQTARVTFKNDFKSIQYVDVPVEFIGRGRLKNELLRILYNRHIKSLEPITLGALLSEARGGIEYNSDSGKHPSAIFFTKKMKLDATSKNILEQVIRWNKDQGNNEWRIFLNPDYQYYEQ